MKCKPIPNPSLDLLLFPQHDTAYVHFEDADSNPFEADARSFSAVNAWWLADAALLAYWDEPQAREIWTRAKLHFKFLSRGGSQCHVAWSERFVIVAFRGTQPNSIQDLLTILDVKHARYEFGGKVHCGFRRAHIEIWPFVQKELDHLANGRTVWFTGHSLGAALADLSMDQFPQAAGVYTIGSPPVGDRRFARGFARRHSDRSFRYVNHHDIIVWLPGALALLLGSYRHVPQRKYINAEGKHSGVLGVRDCVALVASRLKTLARGAVPGVPLPRPVVDHTPKRYAVQIWNALVDRAAHVEPAHV